MQSYLIFSCYPTPFLLKKVKTLFINRLEKLKIDDGKDQQGVNAFIKPSSGCIVEIIGHVNGYRRYGQQEVVDGPICVQVERNKG